MKRVHAEIGFLIAFAIFSHVWSFENSKVYGSDYRIKTKAPTTCNPNPCKNRGDCAVDGVKAKCICRDGYRGKTCEIATTPCNPNPCKNKGDCNVEGAKAKCICKAGYRGEKCEIVVTPCNPNPCRNNGDCAVNGTRVMCICKNGYRGETCEIAPTPCNPNPCKNQGDCAVDGVKANCICKNGYKGDTCEIAPIPCKPNPCKNQGDCAVDGAKSKCICKNGYRGEKCEIAPTPCNPNPCKNQGDCAIDGGNETCICRNGYRGERCEIGPRPCNPNPCKNKGDCVVDGAKAKCICRNGYRGEACEIASTPCNPNPCKNQGVCAVDGVKAKCICKNGYTGEMCEIAPTPCNPNPCKNKGDCATDGAETRCICRNGYKGEMCEIVPTPCNPNPCKNKGDCAVDGAKAKCICKNGYTGETCEIAPTPCNPNPCKNQGDCVVDGAKAKCICKAGYRGEKCEIAVTPCNPNPCRNNGDCAVNGTRVMCRCKNGYRGDLCEIAPTPCNPNPCKNKGDCAVDGTKAKCICKNGYKGEMCEIAPTPCNPNPCKNKGDCAADGAKAKCICKDGYIGETCEIVDYCASNPCQNGGMCTNGENTYICECPDFYEGSDCSRNTWCEKLGKEACGNEKCEYNATMGKGECICEDERVFNVTAKRCIVNHCASNPCQNGGTCTNGEDKYICECPAFYDEKDCSKNTWCEKLGRDECGNEKCEYNAKIAKGECICEDGKIFNKTTKTCIVDHCVSSPCKNGGTCRNSEDAYHCTCLGIYGGKTCEDIIWCDIHGEKVCGDVKCVNDKISKTGYCKCDEYQKFNKISNTCEDMSGCIPKLIQGECDMPHEVCNEKNGRCECETNYTYNSNKNECIENFCEHVICSLSAKCKELGNGETLCVCNKGYFMDSNVCWKIDPCLAKPCTQKCKKGICYCEKGFTLNNDDNVTCDAEKDEFVCDDLNCGVGTCYKSGKESKCICPSNSFVFKNNTCIDICTNKGGKPPSNTCPTNECETTNDARGFRCKCENPYEQDEDGVHCKRKRMCEERVALEECEKEAAVCKENLTSTEGYSCVCSVGFEKEENVCKKKCDIKSHRDKCAALNAICELDENLEVKCVCPPMLTREANDVTKPCNRIAPHSYMGKLRVLKSLYKLKESRRSKRSLTITNLSKLREDMKNSLTTVYGELNDLKLLDCTDEGNMLACSVEMQPVKEPKDVNTIASPNVCVPVNEEYCLVEPSLVLKREDDNTDLFQKTDPCSEEVNSRLCEKATYCMSETGVDFQCRCKKGFYTIGVYHPVTSNKTLVERCNDIDECEDSEVCPDTTNCVNTYGGYDCYCKDKYKKKQENSNIKVEGCEALCSSSPCGNGTCIIVGNYGFTCKCKESFTGIFCNETLPGKAMEQRNAIIVGGALGLPLVIVLIAGYVLYRKMKNDKEDYAKHRQRSIPSEMTGPAHRDYNRDNDIELHGSSRASGSSRRDSGEYWRGLQVERISPRPQTSSDSEISKRPEQRELREEPINSRNEGITQF